MGDQRSPAITMVPRADAAGLSCCGEADACWADQVRVGPNGEIIATITDDRDDGPLKRMHEDIGNNISFHQTKSLKKTDNPSGHAIIFLGTSSIFALRSDPRPALCYVMNGRCATSCRHRGSPRCSSSTNSVFYHRRNRGRWHRPATPSPGPPVLRPSANGSRSTPAAGNATHRHSRVSAGHMRRDLQSQLDSYAPIFAQ